MQKNFFESLQPIRDFSELSEDRAFTRVPEDWHVVITDVRGSTQAVKDGRYRDVNLIGAASISCLLNLTDDTLPFVFGGDGATLVIPATLLAPALAELQALQALAQKQFQLALRVGHVPLQILRSLGTDLCVAKYELSHGNNTAHFKGGALALAEKMVKEGAPAGAAMVDGGSHTVSPKLEGLSCRLLPMKSRQGAILSLLVRPLGADKDAVLKKILEDFRLIFNGDFRSASPVSLERLAWKWPFAGLNSEVKLTGEKTPRAIGWLLRAVASLISILSLKFNFPLGSFKPRRYKSQIVTNSDYKKFDETLRMVVDCSPAQEEKIRNVLETLKSRGQIEFGIHKSPEAVMTCVVKAASTNRHVHFIDGAGGGYTLAATQMSKKSQSKKTRP